jgi:Ethanolamine utilization protein EutJ (predicted chaperonin)
MRLGIDFGTTRIVVAAADRGNYPVAVFEAPDGVARDWIPPLIAARGGRLLYGWDAWSAQGDPDATIVRSLKRVLADSGPGTCVAIGPLGVRLSSLLGGLFGYVRSMIAGRSSLNPHPGEPLEAMLGVPANANSNQRFLTAEGFRAAGFEVLGLLNEPSAASIEYAHRLAGDELRAPERLVVYDLGGGTFDVSLVVREDHTHSVAATESIPTLGGDDFDEALAEIALESAGRAAERAGFTQAEEFRLLEECRQRKESLHPNTRRIVVDLEAVREGWGHATAPVAGYYELARPLVEETLIATEDILNRFGGDEGVTLYATGGASELPLVGRLLRERFGRRLKRSAYTRSATAIGLAIQAEGQSAIRLRERFTRFFGVWREGEDGRLMVFDPLFEKGEELPGPGEPPLERVRTYRPVHNIGHFRYLECSHRGPHGEPTGDVTAWDEIRFPFDAAPPDTADLVSRAVEHSPAAQRQAIEEKYTADSSGAVLVEISNLTAGYRRAYRLGRWASQPEAIAVERAPRRRKRA